MLTAISLSAALLAAMLNLWLLTQLRQQGLRGAFGKLALQLAVLISLWGALRSYGGFLPLAVAAPPLLLLNLPSLTQFQTLLSTLAPFALPAIVLSGGVSLLLPCLRIWAPIIAALTGLFTAIVAAGPITANAMCETARSRGAGDIQRNSFVFSLRHSPAEFQFELHALTEINGQPWGWSYGQMDWYPIPSSAARNLSTPRHSLHCAP